MMQMLQGIASQLNNLSNRMAVVEGAQAGPSSGVKPRPSNKRKRKATAGQPIKSKIRNAKVDGDSSEDDVGGRSTDEEEEFEIADMTIKSKEEAAAIAKELKLPFETFKDMFDATKDHAPKVVAFLTWHFP